MNVPHTLLSDRISIKGGIDLSTTEGRFAEWLGTQTNMYADSCAAYSRVEQESPPERLTQPYQIFSLAWDSYCILVAADESYRASREIQEFVSDYATFDAEGIELYSIYINAVLSTKYGYADGHVKALKSIIEKLGDVIG